MDPDSSSNTPTQTPETPQSEVSNVPPEPTAPQGPVVGSGTSTPASFLKSKPLLIGFVAVFAGIATFLLLRSYAATTVMTKNWQTAADWTTNSTLSNVTVGGTGVTLAAASTTTTTPSATISSTTNLALKRPVVASSIESRRHPASAAVDSSNSTRWASYLGRNGGRDPEWIYVDLGSTYSISEVKLQWEVAYAKAYQIQVSNDAKIWTPIYSTATGDGNADDLKGLAGSGRYVRVYGTTRGTKWGYSLWNFQVFGATGNTSTAPTPPTTAYPASGNITLTFDADAGTISTGSVDWQSATADVTAPTNTKVTYQYSTSSDNKIWSTASSDIATLADSRYLKIQASLATTDSAVTPTLKALHVAYAVTTSTPTPALPTASLSASPSSVTSGNTSTLTWSSTNATSCTASGAWTGTKSASGTFTTPALTTTGSYTIACTGTGGTATASATVTVSAAAPQPPAATSPSGAAMPGAIAGFTQVCGEDFTANAATGSWGTSDASKVVYTGGCKWHEYPDGWSATYTSGAAGYAPAQVLSVHDGVLDFNLKPINGHAQGANPSPVLSNTGATSQTYGKYIVRMRMDKVAGYHDAFLLWPTNDADWQSAETDFPEMDLDDTSVSAFAHYGGSGAQAAFSKSVDLTQWHTYEQDWTPTSRSFYVDGQLIGTTTKALFAKPERFQLQTEPSGTAAGGTGHQLIDWVAIYAPN